MNVEVSGHRYLIRTHVFLFKFIECKGDVSGRRVLNGLSGCRGLITSEGDVIWPRGLNWLSRHRSLTTQR